MGSEGAALNAATRRVVVVGGSLAGLAVANVLARAGADVQVLERGQAGFERRGGGLGLDTASAAALLEGRLPPHLVLTERRVATPTGDVLEPTRLPVTAYGAMWSWLHEGLRATTARLRLGAHVTALDVHDSTPRAVCADGTVAEGDLLVLADGGASALRARLPGWTASQVYAGYVLWRGLVPAAELAQETDLVGKFHLALDPAHHFVAYPIPTPAGDTQAARRVMNWGWYYPLPEADMLRLHDAELSDAPHAIGRRVLPAAWRAVLSDEAARRWPPWARELVTTSLRLGLLAPHPVFEVWPARLHVGRVALIGDVAHQASPITGAGARLGFEDAHALAAALAAHADVPTALAAYAGTRLAAAQAIVAQGQAAGARMRATG